MVRCNGNVYYQVDLRAPIGGKYEKPEAYDTTQTEKFEQLQVACSECTFTVCCCCCCCSDNILD